MRTIAARTPFLLSSGLLAAALVLAGCGGGNSTSPSPAPSASTTAGATPGASGSASASASATAAPETSAPAPAPEAGVVPCTADKLSAAVEDTPGGGAAGSVYRDLVLTNTSSEPCATFGFPGVSYLGISGTQVGAPATRSGGTDAVAVTLAPGQSAVASLRETRPENYGEECSMVGVSGLRVFPPEDTAYLNISRAGHACSSEEVELLEVGPLAGPR